jgi:hypothetical protein
MKPRASSSKTPNNALFGIDESLFTLPKDDEAQVTHVDVKKLLSSVHDDIENVGEDDVDENDPVLLR